MTGLFQTIDEKYGKSGKVGPIKSEMQATGLFIRHTVCESRQVSEYVW